MKSLIEQAKWHAHCGEPINSTLRDWVRGYGRPTLKDRAKFVHYMGVAAWSLWYCTRLAVCKRQDDVWLRVCAAILPHSLYLRAPLRMPFIDWLRPKA